MIRWCVIFAAVLVCAAGSVQAKVFDNYIEMDAGKYVGESEISYQGGVYIGIEGLDDPNLSLEGVNIGNSNWGGYEEMDFDGQEYYVESDSDQSFDDLGINGTWYVDVVSSDGATTYHSVYTWTMSGITEDTWNAIPNITSHSDGDVETNPRPTFAWTVDSVDGDARLVIEVDYQDIYYEHDEELSPTSLLDWIPDFDLPAGEMRFMVCYAIPFSIDAVYDADESAALGTAGGDVVAWSSADAYLFAADRVEIEVVPEPATISLMGLGALAIIRRKKS